MLGSLILYLKGMRRMRFQLSGFRDLEFVRWDFHRMNPGAWQGCHHAQAIGLYTQTPREDPKRRSLKGGSYKVPFSSIGPQIRGFTF